MAEIVEASSTRLAKTRKEREEGRFADGRLSGLSCRGDALIDAVIITRTKLLIAAAGGGEGEGLMIARTERAALSISSHHRPYVCDRPPFRAAKVSVARSLTSRGDHRRR